MHTREEQMKAFGRMLDVLDQLREKCPWDKKQTNESLRPNTIEETYELCDALMKGDDHEVCKELGDVLLHVCFYAKIGAEQQVFDIADVCNKLTDKLIFRHPHIYHPSQVGAECPQPLPFVPSEPSTSTETSANKQPAQGASDTAQFSGAKTAEQVLENWEQIKLREKDGNKSVLSGVPAALPSLIKAYRIQDKARNVGFDWEDRDDVWNKVNEELEELKEELQRGDRKRSTAELGDFLFSVINAARLYKLNPDNALEQTNQKFISRFNYIEQHSIRVGRPLTEMTLAEMDALWNEAKELEKETKEQTNNNL
jgi:XTP/dITP diphosphohydrolase